MKTKTSLLLLLGLCVNPSLWPAVAQQTTAFTYQGQLRDDGANANGTYSMIFKLYGALSGGGQIGSAITNSPTLSDGLFSVNLDFGAGAFDGNARWLDISVTRDGTTQTLAPRGQVLPAPYSLYASAAGYASVAGSVTAGPWTVHSGNFGIPSGTPNGGATNNNVLKFSANGIDWMGISPVGGGLFARSQFTVGGPIYADNLQLNSGGGKVAGDGRGGLVLNNTTVTISSTGVICGTTFCQGSDRNLKENFSTIDGRDILERVVSLPISSWNFKQNKEARHIGPMAQDFHAAFNLGSDDIHIATVDEGGVALAAIQGLNQMLKEKDARIESLEKRLADLERLVKSSAHHETGDRQ